MNRDICQSLGGDLVSIETEQEWNIIKDEIGRRNIKKKPFQQMEYWFNEKGRELDLGEWKTADYSQMGTRGTKW